MKDAYSQRPRALVLTSTFPRWENDPEPSFVLELCKRLSAVFDITVLSPRTPGSEKQEIVAGLRVIRFPYFFQCWEKLAMHGGGILNRLKSSPFSYLLVPLFLFGQISALLRLLRREHFDLIHAHWLIPQGLTAVMGLMLSGQRIPLLCTSHGGDLFALHGPFFRYLKRWVIEHSRALTVVSQIMKSTVVGLGVDPGKVHVISMGVDLKHSFTLDSTMARNVNELLFVGRLVEVKGLSILLEAMPKVLARFPDANLTIAGAGPLEAKMQELAQRLKISEKVKFLGMVTQGQLPGLYRRAHLVILPFVKTKSGVQEGFGLVVVEAMGCGCTVIAGDLPAIQDSILDEKNGLLFPSGNSEVLADTMIRALNDRDLCSRLGQEARKSVEGQFDWEIVAEKYAGIYKEISRV